jgi:hypothetical protein
MFSPVIAESLKTAVDTLSPKERHELSCYLTKLDLQNDADYWKMSARNSVLLAR